MMELTTLSKTKVARDLSRFDNRSRLREEADPIGGQSAAGLLEEGYTPAAKRLKARAKQRARQRAIARLRMLLAAVTGILCMVTLLMSVVYSSMQLGALGVESARLKKEIETLSGEEALLWSQYEQRINLDEIERIAMDPEGLGMIKLEREQKAYIDDAKEDYAVVGGASDTGLLADIWNFFLSLLA